MQSNVEQAERGRERFSGKYLDILEYLSVRTRDFPRVMLAVHENPGSDLVFGRLLQVVICLTRVRELRKSVTSLRLV